MKKKTYKDMTTKTENKYFDYLDMLRESGIMNMYGATPCLMSTFKLPRKKASAILKQWMEKHEKES
jgi:hypothetical protein